MNYQQLKLKELKAIATSKNIIPTGDKRLKETWINALESFDNTSVSNARVGLTETHSVLNNDIDLTRTVSIKRICELQNLSNSITGIPVIESQQCFDAHNFKLPTLESFNWEVAEALKIPDTWQLVNRLQYLENCLRR